MAVKEYKIGVYEDDGVEYSIANEINLLNALKGIKFGGFQRYYIDTDETLTIDNQESYIVANTLYCNGNITLDGVIGVI